MAELATIARPYAEALFRIAATDDLVAWSGFLQTLAQTADYPEIMSLAANPKVNRNKVVDLLLSIAQSPEQEQAKQFVQLIVDNHRLGVLPEISRQFDVLKNAQQGIADAHIASAFPLSDAQLTELTAGLERKFKCKIKPIVNVDTSLIGGIRVMVGDEVWDTSVRAQLAKLQTQLST